MINKQEYIEKLIAFKREISDCTSKKEMDLITQRLSRKIKDVYCDNDPFVKDAETSWPTYAFALVNGWISDEKAEASRAEDIRKNKKKLCYLVEMIIDTIEKDGLPNNTKTAMINQNTIIDSPGAAIASGNTGAIIQNSPITLSDFNKFYDKALEEISAYDNITAVEKEEICDALRDYRECLQQKRNPANSVLRTFARFFSKGAEFGANCATIFQAIQSQVQPFIDQIVNSL